METLGAESSVDWESPSEWAVLASKAVVSISPFCGFDDRIRSALQSEWASISEYSYLPFYMRATASTFYCEDDVSDIRELFLKASYCNFMPDEQKLRNEFLSMTVSGCLSGDTETGAPDDQTVSALFLWLSEISAGDVAVAKQSLNSFVDLLLFLADALSLETNEDVGRVMLERLI